MGGIISLLTALTGFGPLIKDLIKAHEEAASSQNQQAMLIIQSRIDALKAAYSLAATVMGQVIVTSFALVVWIYFAKVVIWDNVLGYYTGGNTPAIHGDVSQWMWLVMSFIFGHGLINSIIKR